MSPDAQKILDEARQLPPSEREWVAHGLLIDESEEIDPQWAAEVERRVADGNSADAPTRSWEELEARLRARLPE
jgi:Putative addiction module component